MSPSIPNKDDDDFIEIDASSIEYVKRGRKPIANPELVVRLSALPKGKALAIASMKQNPSSTTYVNDKARIGSQIRTACRAANLTGFQIRWSPQGVPQVVR
jgi:hypothetical protein